MLRSKLDEFKASMSDGSSGCIIKNGYLIYSWGSISANYDWFSAGKPCLSTMLFAAMHEGRVTGPHSSIRPYWSGLQDDDRRITFRHLADMMSGYASDDDPGSRWSYNDYAIRLYVKTLDRVFQTSDNLVSAGRRLFVDPLQFQDGRLFESSQGHVVASARDFARMAWLWLNRGNWNGTELLPGAYFEAYVKADVPLGTPRSSDYSPDDYLKVGNYGGGLNQHDGAGIYGFNWWFNKSLAIPAQDPPLLAWPSAPADTYLAMGRWGNEAVVVFPSLGMVATAFNPYQPVWGDVYIANPPDRFSRLNHNLRLLTDSVLATPTGPSSVIYPDADVVYAGQAINAVSQTRQINWGLAAFGGFGEAAGRSYLQFEIGTAPVALAKFKLYNYWGGPMYNGQGRLPLVTARLEGSVVDNPVPIDEPPAGTGDPAWVPPGASNFAPIGGDRTLGPFVGWYEWDITDWFNARLGQTTALALRAATVSGYDFPIFEDREGTAHQAGAGGSAANTGPRIEYFLRSLEAVQFMRIERVGNQLFMNGLGGPPSAVFHLLSAINPALPTDEWTRVSTHQFDANGRFSVTAPLDEAVPEMYFRLQLP